MHGILKDVRRIRHSSPFLQVMRLSAMFRSSALDFSLRLSGIYLIMIACRVTKETSLRVHTTGLKSRRSGKLSSIGFLISSHNVNDYHFDYKKY